MKELNQALVSSLQRDNDRLKRSLFKLQLEFRSMRLNRLRLNKEQAKLNEQLLSIRSSQTP